MTPEFEKQILVAGVGNAWMQDDGFGSEVAQRLERRDLPSGVTVMDFGSGGLDLAYEIMRGYHALVLIDVSRQGGEPGTLYVIEPEVGDEQGMPDAHGMDPVQVLALAKAMGTTPPRTLVVGCEPQTRMSADDEEIVAALSEPVRAALDEAVRLVESVLDELTNEQEDGPS